MSYVIFRTKVADYARWKPIFDADGANRQAGGSKGGTFAHLLQDIEGLYQQEQISQRVHVKAKLLLRTNAPPKPE